MNKLIKATFLSTLLLAGAASAQPTNIQLEYDVKRNGKSFGTVKESYVQEGNQYHIQSETKGKGFYSLLGARVLSSDGTVTAKGLVPAQFQSKRGSSEKKTLTANFDWGNNQLNMLVKGETKTAKLMPSALDLASYPYQFMFTPPKGNQLKLALTTGKKLKQYTYDIVAHDAVVNVADESYKTLHLVNAEVDGKKKKELWLAPSAHYIPVKYLVVDKHGDKIEQTLTKISVK